MTIVASRLVLAATVTRRHCCQAGSLPPQPAASARFATATATATLRPAVRTPLRRAPELVVHSAGGESPYYDPKLPLTPRMKKHLRGHANALGSKLCVHQVRASPVCLLRGSTVTASARDL
jgi:hypothetical protein